jgi:glycosyltransferase involved in cell wall biosynthesis
VVSIIVPTYNRDRFLGRCVQSIVGQTYQELECIVVDGASKDNSLAMLRRLAAEDPRLRFVSEPDHDEVYAVNKGLIMVEGGILGQEASGDLSVGDAVKAEVGLDSPPSAPARADRRSLFPSRSSPPRAETRANTKEY